MLGAVLAPIAVASTVMTGGAALPLWAGMLSAAGGYMVGSKLGEETAEATEKGGLQWGEDKYSEGGKDSSYRRSLNSQKFLKREAKEVEQGTIAAGKSLDSSRYTKSLIAAATYGYAKGGDKLKSGLKGVMKGEGFGGVKKALGTEVGFKDLGAMYGKKKAEGKIQKEVGKKIAKGIMPTMEEALSSGSLKKGVKTGEFFKSSTQGEKLIEPLFKGETAGAGLPNEMQGIDIGSFKFKPTGEDGKPLSVLGKEMGTDKFAMPTIGQNKSMAQVIQQNQSGAARIENMKYNISQIPSKIANVFKSTKVDPKKVSVDKNPIVNPKMFDALGLGSLSGTNTEDIFDQGD